jgi:hypothetical protein
MCVCGCVTHTHTHTHTFIRTTHASIPCCVAADPSWSSTARGSGGSCLCTDACRCCAGTYSFAGEAACLSSCPPGTSVSGAGCFSCAAGETQGSWSLALTAVSPHVCVCLCVCVCVYVSVCVCLCVCLLLLHSCCTSMLLLLSLSLLYVCVCVFRIWRVVEKKLFHIKTPGIGVYGGCSTNTCSQWFTPALYSKALWRHLALVFTGVARLKPFYQRSIKAVDRSKAYHSTN